MDTATTPEVVPAIAWDYKLGNRSTLEWILDQYKENKPKDPTIAKLFNTHKFAGYREHVIDLLQRVCTVSVHTMGIIQQVKEGDRSTWSKVIWQLIYSFNPYLAAKCL